MIKTTQQQFGFTLIELMVTVAIIGVLSAIAIPAYNNYVSTSKLTTVAMNAQELIGFEETYFYENDAYLVGSYTGTANAFTNSLEWLPTGDKGLYNYAVSVGTCGDIKKCYKVVVSHVTDPTNAVIIRQIP